MVQNYLSTWVRTLARHKVSTLISVISLAFGLTSAIFILTYLRDELSYDRWIPDSGHLYRVEITLSMPGSAPVVTPSAPFALVDALKSEVADITGATPFVPGRFTVSVGDRRFLETIAFVDPQFFRIIRVPLIVGDADEALAKPEGAVISASLATKLFGAAQPLNRTILLNGTQSLVVTGVIADLPYNTQLVGDLFVASTSPVLPLSPRARHDWLAFVRHVYISLKPGADARLVRDKIAGLFAKYLNPDMLSSMHLASEQLISVRLTRFRDAHLTTTKYVSATPVSTSSTTLYGFAAIALLVLAVACSNFASMATAQSTTRAREIAMRKILGAPRAQLIRQFLLESLLLTALACLLAIVLVAASFPLFIRIIGHETTLGSSGMVLMIASISLVTGLVAGLYPALVLSNLSPAIVLKSSIAPHVGRGRLRRFLVIAQFAISIALAVATVVIFLQVRYERDFDLGFQHENVVIVDTSVDPGITDSTRETFLDSLTRNPAIVGAAASATVPFQASDARGTVTIPGNSNTFFVRSQTFGAHFPEVYGLHLVAGRLLSKALAQDQMSFQGNAPTDDGRNVMISASAAAAFGFSPTDSLGKTIQVRDGVRVQIVGVLQDTFLHGADEPVVPTIFYYSAKDLRQLSIRVRSDHMSQALETIDEMWRTLLPNVAISRHMLDDDFERLFGEREKQGLVIAVFASLTVIVACLGLFGLSTFTVQRDAKEIGLRRVFGASSASIIRWQLKRFSMLVVLACAVAWPIAAWCLHFWLEGFAHRIELNPTIFLCVGLGALGIAWITIIGHVLRAARLDPVEILRYE